MDSIGDIERVYAWLMLLTYGGVYTVGVNTGVSKLRR